MKKLSLSSVKEFLTRDEMRVISGAVVVLALVVVGFMMIVGVGNVNVVFSLLMEEVQVHVALN